MSCENVSSCKRRWIKRFLYSAIGVILGLILLLSIFTLLLYIFHPRLIYKPRPFKHLPEKELLDALAFPKAPQSMTLVSSDGTKLRAYWLKHEQEELLTQNEKKLPVLVFLHGNKGDVIKNLKAARMWQEKMPVAMNVLVPFCRGFGYSEGTPDIEGMRMDSQKFLDHLLASSQVDSSMIWIYGHSMGGAVALDLVARNPKRFQVVMIENTFLSIIKMVKHAQPALQWFAWVVTERWDNETSLERLIEWSKVEGGTGRIPHLMMISGGKDTVVPPEQMEQLWNQSQALLDCGRAIIKRNHLRECRHSCIKVEGYFEGVHSFMAEVMKVKRDNNDNSSD